MEKQMTDDKVTEEELEIAKKVVKDIFDCNDETFECYRYKTEYAGYISKVSQALSRQREEYEKAIKNLENRIRELTNQTDDMGRKIRALEQAGDELFEIVEAINEGVLSTPEFEKAVKKAISNWLKARGGKG